MNRVDRLQKPGGLPWESRSCCRYSDVRVPRLLSSDGCSPGRVLARSALVAGALLASVGAALGFETEAIAHHCRRPAGHAGRSVAVKRAAGQVCNRDFGRCVRRPKDAERLSGGRPVRPICVWRFVGCRMDALDPGCCAALAHASRVKRLMRAPRGTSQNEYVRKWTGRRSYSIPPRAKGTTAHADAWPPSGV